MAAIIARVKDDPSHRSKRDVVKSSVVRKRHFTSCAALARLCCSAEAPDVSLYPLPFVLEHSQFCLGVTTGRSEFIRELS